MATDYRVSTPKDIGTLVRDIFDGKIDPAFQDIYLLDGTKKKKFNENIYFIINKSTEMHKESETKENEELVEAYKGYINKVQELVDSLNIDDELLTAIVVRELLLNGYFSYRARFSSVNNVDFLHFYLGIPILLGEGCCRHVSEFYKDIFEGIYKHPLLYAGRMFKLDDNNGLHHAINLIEYQDKMCGYDVLNGALFFFNTPYEMEPLGEPNYRLRFESYWNLLHSRDNYRVVRKNFRLFAQSIGNGPTLEELNEKMKLAQTVLDDNYRLLRKFYRDTTKDKTLVRKKVLSKYGKPQRSDIDTHF